MFSGSATEDQERLATVRDELFTAVIGDVLDTMGLTRQFLPATIRPLAAHMRVVGRAMPVLQADYPSAPEAAGGGPLAGKPFGVMLEALDDLRRGEVYVAGTMSADYALWGELMSTRAMHLGAAGAVLGGHSRDTEGILSLDFPVFSTGPYAQDQGARGKVLDWRTPIMIGQAMITPGDLIVADLDGVLVVPQAAEGEAVTRALEKVRGERTVAEKIREGMSATEAYRTYGVL